MRRKQSAEDESGTESGDSRREPDEFQRALQGLGFIPTNASKRGGLRWSLQFNSVLTFDIHEQIDGADDTPVLFTWSAALAPVFSDRGMTFAGSDDGFGELYPKADIKLARDIDAVSAELRRSLGTLQLDLTDPSL